MLNNFHTYKRPSANGWWKNKDFAQLILGEMVMYDGGANVSASHTCIIGILCSWTTQGCDCQTSENQTGLSPSQIGLSEEGQGSLC